MGSFNTIMNASLIFQIKTMIWYPSIYNLYIMYKMDWEWKVLLKNRWSIWTIHSRGAVRVRIQNLDDKFSLEKWLHQFDQSKIFPLSLSPKPFPPRDDLFRQIPSNVAHFLLNKATRAAADIICRSFCRCVFVDEVGSNIELYSSNKNLNLEESFRFLFNSGSDHIIALYSPFPMSCETKIIVI